MQSGIAASQELLDAFNTLVSTPSQRGLLITIASESLVPSHVIDSRGSFNEDLHQLDPLLSETEAKYIILRRNDQSSGKPPFIAITYVPDAAKVRQKMLFASTRTTLLRELGTDRFDENIFATMKSELTEEGFKKHDAHGANPAPLTEEERLLKEVRELESALSTGTASRKSHVSSSLGFPLSPEAMFALKSLDSSTTHNFVQLSIDIEKETIELVNLEAGVDANDLPKLVSSEEPRFTFFVFHHTYEGKQEAPIVFLYTCPPSAKIKHRMVYASSRGAIILVAEREAGLVVAKRLEAALPTDFNHDLLMEEFHPKKEEKASFSRPKRPGRR